jgi:hypothetical protein
MRSDSVQHERKPIIDKKDYSNNIGNNYNSNSVNKIFIRKDLSTDSPGLLPAPFNPCDLGLQFLNKRIDFRNLQKRNKTAGFINAGAHSEGSKVQNPAQI